ncbi:MAG: tetratricopeptide repeat protein [Bacteroidales bacterium]|nr:tetratricopeptide repeat protein [Bacteroidales bacterium]
MKYCWGCLFLFIVNAWCGVHSQEDKAAYLKLADYYKFINEDSCQYFANEAYRVALEHKDIRNQAEALGYLAYVNRYKGNYEIALDLTRNMQELAQRIDDKYLYARSLYLFGAAYMEMEIFDAAYSNLSSAIRIYQNLPDKAPIAAFYNTMAVLYARQGEIEKAQSYIERGLAVADTVDKREAIILNNNQAFCYLYQQKPEEGERLLKRQIEVITRYNIPYNSASIYQNLCRIHIDMENYPQALEYGEAALASARNRNNRRSMAQVLYYIGNIYLAMGRYDTAIVKFRAVDSIATDLDLLEIKLYTAGHLAYIYEQEGNFEQAYEWSKKQNKLTDSFNKKNGQNELYRLNIEYQYEQEMARVKDAGKKRNIAWGIGVLILVLLTAVLWLILSRQRFKLNNAKLNQQNTLLALEQRNREITSKAMRIQQKDKAISDSIAQLSQSRHGLKKNDQSVINEVIRKLSLSINENAWNEFELRFERVYTGFFKTLSDKFPNLSPNEKRLCAYLKLNLSSKEIANLTHTTVGSVEQARFRLRKKLGLHTTNTDLVSFIERL